MPLFRGSLKPVALKDVRFSAKPFGGWSMAISIPKARPVRQFKPHEVDFQALEMAYRSWRPRSTYGADRKQASAAQEEELKKLWKGFRFMQYVHGAHARPDGTVQDTQYRRGRKMFGRRVRYEEHPFNAALYAARSGCDVDTIIAAMLHDCVEDRQVRLKDIEHHFGEDVRYMVNRLSTPRLADADTKGAEREEVTLQDGTKHVIHVVYPDTESFHSENVKNRSKGLDDEKIDGRLLNHEALVELQAERMFRPHKEHLSERDFKTILIKQFEGLHNLQTLEKMKESTQIRRVEKSVSYALSFFDRLSPAFMNSVPPGVKKILERLDPHYREKFPQPPRKENWFVRLEPRAWLNRWRLHEVPATSVNQINIHGVPDADNPGKTLPHTFEVGFPYSMVGSGEAVSDGLLAELKRQFSAHLLPEDSVRVEKGETMLPPGLASFHFFTVDMSSLDSPRRHFNQYLVPALSQTLARFHTDPLMELDSGYRDRLLNPVKNQPHAYYARFPGSDEHVSLFLPHDHFGGRRAAKRIRNAVQQYLSQNQGRIVSSATGVGHRCATFHTVEFSLKPRLRRDKIERELARVVGHIRTKVKPPWRTPWRVVTDALKRRAAA